MIEAQEAGGTDEDADDEDGEVEKVGGSTTLDEGRPGEQQRSQDK